MILALFAAWLVPVLVITLYLALPIVALTQPDPPRRKLIPRRPASQSEEHHD